MTDNQKEVSFSHTTGPYIMSGRAVLTPIILLMLALSSPAWSAEPDVTVSNPKKLAELWASVRPDPRPAELCKNSHFVVSDESDHWLFRQDIKNLGGAMIGVGTDSNYLMAGWSRPEILVLLDFDQVVADVHKVYRAAFLAAGTPAEFRELWSKKSAPVLEGLVEKSLTNPEERQQALKALKMSRNLIEVRLTGQIRQHKALGIPTFLDDQDQYNHIVRLFRENRVLIVRGDLTGTLAMRDAARACKSLGVPVRILYLSNAEVYFDYVQSFRENIKALPFDGRSLVLHTSVSSEDAWSAKGYYRYQVQKAADYLLWLERPSVMKVRAIRVGATRGKETGLYYLSGPPEPSKKTKSVKGKPAATR